MSGLVHKVLVDGEEIKAVGFLSKNQFQLSCFEIATQLGGYTAVPLYDTFGVDAIKYIITNVKASLVFVDGVDKQIKNIVDICKAMGTSNPITNLVFSSLNDDQRKTLNQIPKTIKI